MYEDKNKNDEDMLLPYTSSFMHILLLCTANTNKNDDASLHLSLVLWSFFPYETFKNSKNFRLWLPPNC